jgi:NDP-sugar pyrophosphorylase family protein
MSLEGWTDKSTGEIRWANNPKNQVKELAFSGIHIISPEFFSLVKKQGKFSIIDTYLELAATNPIYGFFQPGITWFDLGKPGQIETVSGFLSEHPEFTSP